jgi:hypothetical protein
MHFLTVLVLYISRCDHITALPYPLPIIPQYDTQNDALHAKAWSKEAILTLIGLCTAIACFIIGLAWPRLRQLLCRIPDRMSSRPC